jgi:hypothetical protein
MRTQLAAVPPRPSPFVGFTPFRGLVPGPLWPNWLGVLTAHHFAAEPAPHDPSMPAWHEPPLPRVEDGESFFEWLNVLNAVSDAEGMLTVVSLGAHYGRFLVNAAALAAAINPMPFHLVAVEADPTQTGYVRQHFANNGIDPAEHAVINAAVGADNRPLLFPTGAGTGANTAFTKPIDRASIAEQIVARDLAPHVVRRMFADGTTGLDLPLYPGGPAGQLVLVSCLTVADVVAPYDRIDYLEADIQGAEEVAFPPARRILKRKVRRLHIGTHGEAVHADLLRQFVEDGWRVEADYYPGAQHLSPFGAFRTNDGILTLGNPDLLPA